MKTIQIFSIVVLSMFASAVFAQNTNTPHIDQSQSNQQARIANGINSGALTAKEGANLERREAKIEADKVAAKADGKVTMKERARLRHEENRTSQKIFDKKHNARHAG